MDITRKQLEETVKEIIESSTYGIDVPYIDLQSLLFTDLGADDMDILQTISALSEMFDIEITCEEFNLETMQTVKDVCDFVEVKLNCK